MKCYYTYDELTKSKVLIPQCWSVVHSYEIKDCNCDVNISFHQFEKQSYNKIIAEKNKEIEYLQFEIKRLNKLIKI